MFGQSEQMFDKLSQNKSNLADQPLLTITLIAFFGFMKFSEISRLRPSDLVFSSTYVKGFIEKIKTNNIIGKECGFTSQFLVKFVHWNNLNITWPSQNISKFWRIHFRGLLRGKKFGLRTKQINKWINKPISYSRVRENWGKSKIV